MGFYWVKTNTIIKKLLPSFQWEVSDPGKKVYLTFDDGPIEIVTEWVLAELSKYNAKATFFCIGKNIDANPGIFKKILRDGHSVGNHTYDHMNGWSTDSRSYLQNTAKTAASIEKLSGITSVLFRPPYGKLGFAQTKALRKLGYKIVMWDILSGDFDHTISREECLGRVIKHVVPGSIVIFHDSVKAFGHLEYVLPKTLEFLSEKGYECAAL